MKTIRIPYLMASVCLGLLSFCGFVTQAQQELAPKEGGASGVGGGGDIFDLSIYGKHGKVKFESFKTFDQIEYENPFMPSDLNDYSSFIAPQLAAIEAKLPETGKYIRGMFEGEGPMWYFVEASLKEVNDEESTQIDLSSLRYQKVQLAILSPDDLVVQVNEALFNKLPVPTAGKVSGRAFAIMHEGLRAAITRNVFMVQGTRVDLRKLTGMLLNPNITRYSAENIGRMILTAVQKSGPLALKVAHDLKDQALIESLTFEQIDWLTALKSTSEYKSTVGAYVGVDIKLSSALQTDGSIVAVLVLLEIPKKDWTYGSAKSFVVAQAFHIKKDDSNSTVLSIEATTHKEVIAQSDTASPNGNWYQIRITSKVEGDAAVSVKSSVFTKYADYSREEDLESVSEIVTFTAAEYRLVQKVEQKKKRL